MATGHSAVPWRLGRSWLDCGTAALSLLRQTLVESKTRTYHGRDGAAHGGTAGQDGDGQGGTPTGRFAQETTDPLTHQTIEENLLGRVSGRTDKGNPMSTGGGIKCPVADRFITGLSAGRRPLFVHGC